VAQKLLSLTIMPEAYCQKWFMALNIHLLSYDLLIAFFENFFQHGFEYLFQFGLALAEKLEGDILEAKTHAEVFALLRLDEEVAGEKVGHVVCEGIVKRAGEIDLGNVEWEKLREEMYEKHLKARMEAAERRLEESDSDDYWVSDSETESETEEEVEKELIEGVEKLKIEEKS